MQHVRFLAATVGVAAPRPWRGRSPSDVAASAATRLRSGSLHAQLVSRVTPAGTTSSSHLLGSGVMAGIVGSLAVLALAFLVVTLIRRRVTAPSPRPTA